MINAILILAFLLALAVVFALAWHADGIETPTQREPEKEGPDFWFGGGAL